MGHHVTGVRGSSRARFFLRILAAILLGGSVSSPHAAITTLASFTAPNGDGPNSRLVQGPDGNFYGTARLGGHRNKGVVFKLTSDGQLSPLASFDGSNGATPTRVVADADGTLYGITARGGTHDVGTVFKVTPSGQLTTLVSFTEANGSYPTALILGEDGNLYGVTQHGTAYTSGLFRVSKDGVFAEIATNVGYYSDWLLQAADGSLFVTSRIGGSYASVVRVSLAGVVEPVSSTNYIAPGMVEGPDGYLYGTIAHPYWASTAFRLSPDGALTILASFDGIGDARTGLTLGSDGNFYGTTVEFAAAVQFAPVGRAFRMMPDGTLTVLASSGLGEMNGLVQGSSGDFFGTASFGNSLGAAYRLSSSGVLTTLAVFQPDGGASPYATLVQGSDGDLYGSTIAGGTYGHGTLFRVSTSGVLTTLHSFDRINGRSPATALVEGADGSFYGTTRHGGEHDYGTVFRITPQGDLTTLVSFSGTNGAQPMGKLLQAADGNFYGTTSRGGSVDLGTVFRITSSSGALTTLLSFEEFNGFSPLGGLVEADGYLYGTAAYGSVHGRGNVYRILPSGTDFQTIASFNGSDGAYPRGSLLLHPDGNFYGGTAADGASGQGTVFKVAPTGVLTTLVPLNPQDGLVLGLDGHLYGTTSSGIFQITPFGTLTGSAAADGSEPRGGLVQGADGNFYGTTSNGGPGGFGTVFRLDAPPPSPTDVTATAGNGYVQLAWTASPDADGYNVYAGLSPEDPFPRLVSWGSSTLQTVTGLTNGTAYYFTVRAVNDPIEGASSNEVGATPDGPIVSASLSSSPSTIVQGSVASLTWSSNNAVSCSAGGAWSGAKSTSGTEAVTPPVPGTHTYTLTCINGNQSATASTSLTVTPAPSPTLAFSVSPTSITRGASAALNWSSSNTTSCTASGAWSGAKATSGNQSVSPTAAGTYTYNLSCTGAGGSISRSATLTVQTPAPTVSISVSPPAITQGSSASLNWSSTDATSCTASGAWSGAKSTSGSQTVAPASAGTHTYTLVCTGAGGSASGSTSLVVNARPPTVTLSASPSTITRGSSASLSWSSSNATSCTAGGAWSGSRATSGSMSVAPATAGAYTYTLTCSGAGGSASGSVVLTVNPPPPTVTFAIDPGVITLGDNSTLTWSSTDASACSASGDWNGDQATIGSSTVSPISTGAFTYGLTCVGPSGTANATVTLSVQPSVWFEGATASAGESAGPFVIRMRLSAATNVDVTVPLTFGGNAQRPADFDASGSVLRIPAGMTQGSLSLSIVDDGSYEPTESIVVIAQSPTNAELTSPDAHVVSIVDNDARVSLTPATATAYLHEQQCLTARTFETSGASLPRMPIQISRTGVNSGSASATTGDTGTATHCWTGSVSGTDTVQVTFTYASASSSITWSRRPVNLQAKGAYTVAPLAGQVTVNPQATLSDSRTGAGIAGRTVRFIANGKTICSAITAGDGIATCQVPVFGRLHEVIGDGVTAQFSGDQTYVPATTSAPLVCLGANCSLAP